MPLLGDPIPSSALKAVLATTGLLLIWYIGNQQIRLSSLPSVLLVFLFISQLLLTVTLNPNFHSSYFCCVTYESSSYHLISPIASPLGPNGRVATRPDSCVTLAAPVPNTIISTLYQLIHPKPVILAI